MQDYENWKKMFSIVEEGVDKENPEFKAKLWERFANYLYVHKVTKIEDLCVEFDMNTKEAVEMIRSLEQDGKIKGIIDERGKYILITEEELQSIVKTMREKGRISKQTLVKEANRLVRLSPLEKDLEAMKEELKGGVSEMERAMEEELKRG